LLKAKYPPSLPALVKTPSSWGYWPVKMAERDGQQRVHHVVAGQGRSGLLEGHQVRHVADQVPGQVVGEHEDEVRPVVGRGLGMDGGRRRTADHGSEGKQDADHDPGES
jgi:hypothetical protein